ncbi:hypothetical protein [Limnoglobus roseus]|uniref:hypothetical protein n=1 Tax=Limnoglobus roseus TaxID=2598579 RepID=UPI0011EA903F|nr:hypothetical protein [Limnoglobus roseus]
MAAHPSLRGDPRLGDDAHTRFLPSRFTPGGGALDELGAECTNLACPACHLVIPRLCFEHAPWFVSIVGAPGSGKSYYLASAVQMLRRHMPDWFQVSFTDTQADFNQLVVGYEEQLFVNYNAHKPAALNQLVQKTQVQSPEHHSSVIVAGQSTLRPRPMLFSVRPQQSSDRPQPSDQSSRVMCLYDNAGESFLSDEVAAASPVTQHLAKAKLLLFLFDPTLHAKFHNLLSSQNIPIASDMPLDAAARRQHLILTEMANRTRRHSGMAAGAKTDKILVVVVTKKDLWGPLLMRDHAGGPVVMDMKAATALGRQSRVLRLDKIEAHSQRLRQILLDSAREIVDAAEGFASTVLYIGVSSLGVQPRQDPASKKWVVAPQDIKPDWVEVPILYGLNKTVPNLITAGRAQSAKL